MNKIGLCALIAWVHCIVAPISAETSNQWDTYFKNTLNVTEPRKTIDLVSKYFLLENKMDGFAADLGCGTGRDALYLLGKGWKVLALDAEQLAIDILLSRVCPDDSKRLQVQVSTFSEMDLPYELDLINASLSLPFCLPQDFATCWAMIVDHITVGGRFAGMFFGDQDQWASNPELTIFSQDALLQLFHDRFEIEYFQVEKGRIPAVGSKMKSAHMFHIIARKLK